MQDFPTPHQLALFRSEAVFQDVADRIRLSRLVQQALLHEIESIQRMLRRRPSAMHEVALRLKLKHVCDRYVLQWLEHRRLLFFFVKADRALRQVRDLQLPPPQGPQ